MVNVVHHPPSTPPSEYSTLPSTPMPPSQFNTLPYILAIAHAKNNILIFINFELVSPVAAGWPSLACWVSLSSWRNWLSTSCAGASQ